MATPLAAKLLDHTDTHEGVVAPGGQASLPPSRPGCRTCGLTVHEHGVRLIHRFVHTPPPCCYDCAAPDPGDELARRSAAGQDGMASAVPFLAPRRRARERITDQPDYWLSPSRIVEDPAVA